MITANQAERQTSDVLHIPPTLLPLCPLCGSDDAEPEGVTGRFDGPAHASLILRCGDCTAVYLNPAPPESGTPPPPLPLRVFSRRRVRAWTQGLPCDARILSVDCAGGQHLKALACRRGWVVEGTEQDAEAAARAKAVGLNVSHGTLADLKPQHNGYHLVLLPHTLEATATPLALLMAVRSLLLPGGRAIIIVSNLESPSFRLFGGRHWDGYHYPRTRQYFNPTTIRDLSNRAGFNVQSIKTMFAPDVWRTSMRNLLIDWQAPGGLTGVLSSRYVIPLMAATVIEGIACMLRRGSLLIATLEKR